MKKQKTLAVLLAGLIKFPKVDSAQEIECFMRGVKDEEYYGEKKENRK